MTSHDLARPRSTQHDRHQKDLGSGADRALPTVAPNQQETRMNSRTKLAVISALTASASLVLAGCGGNAGGTKQETGATGDVTHVEGAPSWCGTKKITFA